ncbi:MAG: PQQ-binding-like beta-propeller repeat protein, partial [Candidatus Bathyarchaeota archaeon]|nr:PQQ-binding-like beta-propeller repeat protein [Candidatus Bathyarchaeota archaeon]
GAIVLNAPGTPVGALDKWTMFDAYSGNYMCTIENVPVAVGALGMGYWGTQVYGKDGSILLYNIVTANDGSKYLQCWNTSQAIHYKPTWDLIEYWLWRPVLNATYDGRNGYSLNASVPSIQGTIRTVREDQYVIGGTPGSNNENGITLGNLWALSLKSGEEGKLLWNITFTPPSSAGNLTISMGTVDPEDGVFLFSCTQTRQWWGYSLETGQQLWVSESGPQLNYYGMSSNIYEGKLLSYGYGGVLIAYYIKTGTQLWNYTAAQEGFESPYGNYPLNLACIVDGKIYLDITDHSPSQPLWRGSNLRCVNASNGAEIWKLLYFGGPSFTGNTVVAADGYIVALNFFDNQIYCIGKGPSAITVDAPLTAIPQGEEVVIRGTVTDVCVGAKQLVEDGKFNVVPAISDDDQQAWMEYMYMQQAKPTDTTGVSVHLTAIDPNGNFQDLGTATSNDLGNYALSWTPPVPGLYTVTATFEGSNAYYSSQAGTSFAVKEPTVAAPVVTPTQAPTQTEAPSTSVPIQSVLPSPLPSEAPQPATSAGTPTWTYIAIGAAVIVIVAVAAVLILRRRK